MIARPASEFGRAVAGTGEQAGRQERQTCEAGDAREQGQGIDPVLVVLADGQVQAGGRGRRHAVGRRLVRSHHGSVQQLHCVVRHLILHHPWTHPFRFIFRV